MRMRRRRFETLVRAALATLPPELRRVIDNLEIVVEDWPSDADLADAGVPAGETLFGLYVGIPLTERTSSYGLVLPDKIIIFQGPLEDWCQTHDELVNEVRTTVVHEVAHHFGISDARLRELGWG
jgi:predicted Zn-dependent protease with MMP-like domain